MKCIKCGAYVYSSDKFCRSCGTTLTEETCKYGDNIANSKYDSSSCHNQQYNYSYEYSNKSKDSNTTYTNSYEYDDKYGVDYSKYNYAMPNDSGGEDKYIKAYIGPNYNSIKNMKFSVPAFIFGPLYLLYRKVWNYAIAIIIISIAATFLLSDSLAELVNIAMNVFIALKFKDIYLKQADEKTEHIQQQNLDKTTNELLELCKKKGGISKIPLILIILAPIIIAIAVTVLEMYIEYDSKTYSEDESAIMTYTLPDGFTSVYENNEYKTFKYNTSTGSSCNITVDTLHLTSTYPDEESYLNYTFQTYGSYTVHPIQELTLNNRTWKMKKLEGLRIETGYASVEDDKIYIIKTHHYKSNGQDIVECQNKYNEFLNTVKIG